MRFSDELKEYLLSQGASDAGFFSCDDGRFHCDNRSGGRIHVLGYGGDLIRHWGGINYTVNTCHGTWG